MSKKFTKVLVVTNLKDAFAQLSHSAKCERVSVQSLDSLRFSQGKTVVEAKPGVLVIIDDAEDLIIASRC